MFDPNNFYQVFYENFIDDASIMYVPSTNGEKQLLNLVELTIPGKKQSLDFATKARLKKVFMYDQEPILPGFTDLLRNYFQYAFDLSQHGYLHRIDDSVIVALLMKNLSFPIWCTSEENSQDIEKFSRVGIVPCYYWYHAFISRDWFRHWQYNKSLAVKDKSHCRYRFLIYSRDHTGTRGYRKDVLDQLRPLADKISYNWAGEQTVSPEYSAKIDVHDAQSSAIHLVAETLFHTDKRYLTEKIFKPIVMSQPFLVFSAPGTLAYLRRYGFQTFDQVWDESYDMITDHSRRLQAVCEIVKTLAALPQDEFQSMYCQCLSVIDHNRRHFFNHGFIDLCWKELSDNWANAQYQTIMHQRARPWGPGVDMVGQNPKLLKIPLFAQMAKNMLGLAGDADRILALKTYPRLTEL